MNVMLASVVLQSNEQLVIQLIIQFDESTYIVV